MNGANDLYKPASYEINNCRGKYIEFSQEKKSFLRSLSGLKV